MPRPTLPTLGPGPESPVRVARPRGLSFERPGRARGGRANCDDDHDADDRRRGGRTKRDDGGSVLGDGRFQRIDPKTYKRTPTGIVGNLPGGSYKEFGGDLYRDLKAPPIQGIAGRPGADLPRDFPGPSRGEMDYTGPDRKRGGLAKARASMERRGTVGALHRELGVPEGEKIGGGKLDAAKARAKRTGNSRLMKRVTFAQNFGGR